MSWHTLCNEVYDVSVNLDTYAAVRKGEDNLHF